eukprot:COSAG01_NODE_3390_length_6151_cov_11.615995_4_plen_104_part_00
MSAQEIEAIIAGVGDTALEGEINFEEFKKLMLSALPPDATDEAKVLRRKARTTVRPAPPRTANSDSQSSLAHPVHLCARDGDGVGTATVPTPHRCGCSSCRSA